MIYLILGLVALGVIAMIAGIFRERKLHKMLEKGEIDKMPEIQELPTDCEGCMRDCSMSPTNKPIVYYNDEELDRFKGTASDAYDEAAVDEFREVLYTLRESEVADWLRSLQQREVNLPDAVKDEAFMMLTDKNDKSSTGGTVTK
jgi:hypothetical protein